MRKHTRRRVWPAGHMLLPGQRDAIVLPVHTALMAMEMGGGHIDHRHTLAAFLNIVGALASQINAAPQTRQAIADAQDALVSADKRYLGTTRWGLSGPEMVAIRQAVTLGDELMKRANSTVLRACIEWVHRVNNATPEVLGTHTQPLGAA